MISIPSFFVPTLISGFDPLLTACVGDYKGDACLHLITSPTTHPNHSFGIYNIMLPFKTSDIKYATVSFDPYKIAPIISITKKNGKAFIMALMLEYETYKDAEKIIREKDIIFHKELEGEYDFCHCFFKGRDDVFGRFDGIAKDGSCVGGQINRDGDVKYVVGNKVHKYVIASNTNTSLGPTIIFQSSDSDKLRCIFEGVIYDIIDHKNHYISDELVGMTDYTITNEELDVNKGSFIIKKPDDTYQHITITKKISLLNRKYIEMRTSVKGETKTLPVSPDKIRKVVYSHFPFNGVHLLTTNGEVYVQGSNNNYGLGLPRGVKSTGDDWIKLNYEYPIKDILPITQRNVNGVLLLAENGNLHYHGSNNREIDNQAFLPLGIKNDATDRVIAENIKMFLGAFRCDPNITSYHSITYLLDRQNNYIVGKVTRDKNPKKDKWEQIEGNVFDMETVIVNFLLSPTETLNQIC